jgi:hypothetical protein
MGRVLHKRRCGYPAAYPQDPAKRRFPGLQASLDPAIHAGLATASFAEHLSGSAFSTPGCLHKKVINLFVLLAAWMIRTAVCRAGLAFFRPALAFLGLPKRYVYKFSSSC